MPQKYKNSFIEGRVNFLVPKFFSLATIDKSNDRKDGGIGWDFEAKKLKSLAGWKDLALDEFNHLRFTYPDNAEEHDRTYNTVLSTIPLLKRQLKQEIKDRSADFSDVASSRTAALIAGHFGAYLSELFTPFTRQKNMKYQERVERRTKSDDSFIEIRIKPYLEEAMDILENLNGLSQADWVSVSVALAVLTGRRMSEIHHSARFYPSDTSNTIIFRGQLKGKGRRVDSQRLIEKEFEIPVLGKPIAIIQGLDWLEKKGKRIEFNGKDVENKNTLVNKRWGKQLSTEVRANWNFLSNINPSDHPDLHPNDLKCSYHKMRALYAASLLHQWHYTSPHSHRIDQKLTNALCDRNSDAAQSYKRYVIID